MDLRKNQRELLHAMWDSARRKKKILAVAPCGFGKTVVFSQIAASLKEGYKEVLIIVHRDVLVKQAVEKLNHFGIEPGIIKGSVKEERTKNVQVASAQTLARRDISWFNPKTMIVDEAHITTFHKSVQKLIQAEGVFVLGFTATPWTLGRKNELGDWYEEICIGATPAEMIKEGFLSPPIYYAVPTIDVNGVRTRAGEYVEDDLAVVCNTKEHLTHAYEQWNKFASGKRTLVFTVNIQHAKDVADVFSLAGIPAAFVAGNTPRKEREELYNKLATGELLVLASCEVLSEGFDCPAAEVAISARPTKSKAKYVQQIGRILRIADGKKNCIILDQSGNIHRFGTVTDISRESLTLKKSEDREPQPPPYKECQQCNALVLCFCKRCPHCGYEFPTEKVFLPITDMQRVFSRKDRTLRRLIKTAYKKGYKPGYPFIKYKEKYGEKPSIDAYRGALFGNTPTHRDYLSYKKHLEALNLTDNKVRMYLRFEFGDALECFRKKLA